MPAESLIFKVALRAPLTVGEKLTVPNAAAFVDGQNSVQPGVAFRYDGADFCSDLLLRRMHSMSPRVRFDLVCRAGAAALHPVPSSASR